jgi:glyoxylase-like metal-dependent hydrolase (beta-lactamase superfamily II)
MLTANLGARTGALPTLVSRFSLLLAMGTVAACSGSPGVAGQDGAPGVAGDDGNDGNDGNDGSDGAAPAVDPNLSPLKKALAAIGGEESIKQLKSFSYTAKGSRQVDGESFLPTSPALQVNTFEATVRYDIAGSDLRIDTKRQITALGFNVSQNFSEIIADNLGHIEGTESIFMQPSGAMSSARWASSLKQQRLLNPQLILRDVVADGSLATEGGLALLDGGLHHLLVIKDDIYPITLFVNVTTGRIAKASTMENDPLHRDRELAAHYIGWEPSTGGPLFPKQVAITFGETVLHTEVREPVTANASIDATIFKFPAGSMPTYDEADAHRGEQGHQYHQIWSSFGIPKDTLHTFVNPVVLEPGVVHLTGGSHNSMVIEQQNGLVLVDAPLYQERSEAILTYLKTAFPTKSVTHMVISHHHQDHSAGARTILAGGAKVVVGKASAEFFRGIFVAPSTIRPDALALKPQKTTIDAVPEGGSITIPDAVHPVTAYHVKSTHSADLLMIHVGGVEQSLFIVDIYSPGSPPVPAAAQELYDSITVDHKIGVTKIAGGHGATATFDEFKALVPKP